MNNLFIGYGLICLAAVSVAWLIGRLLEEGCFKQPAATRPDMQKDSEQLRLELAQKDVALQKLQEEAAKYQAIIEQAGDGVVVLDKMLIKYANPGFVSILGFDIMETANKPILDFIWPENLNDFNVSFKKYKENSKAVVNQEFLFKSKSGAKVFAEANIQPVLSGGSSFDLLIIRDVTARKEYQKKIAAKEEKYELLIMTIPDVIYEVDLNGNFIFVSDAVKNMGYEAGELIGHNFKEIIHPDDYPEINREIVLPQYKGKVTGDEKSPKLFDERRTDGRMTKDLRARLIAKKPQDKTVYYRYVEIHSSGKWDRELKDPDKQYLGSIGVIHDITKRRVAEEAMENRLEFERIIAILSTHFINISAKDIDKGIDHTLQAVGEFVGVDRSYVFLYSDDNMAVGNSYEWCGQGIKSRIQNMQNMDITALPFLNAKMRKLEVFYAPRISGLGDEAKAEKELFAAQDVKSMVCVPMIYGGKLTGFFGFDSVREEKVWSEDIISLLKIVGETFTNAIERKITQIALEKTYGQLKETQSQLYEAEKMEVIARLASGVAHEVKNPLATILMGIDYLLIKIKAEDETVSGTLFDMKTAVERADRIVRGLLDFASISKLDMSPQDINSVIESSLLLLKHQFDKNHVSVSRELKDKLPYVKLDKNRLEQALINILLNAIQAVGEGGQVKIKTYTISAADLAVLDVAKSENPADEEAALVVEIEDNGPGIPENNLSKIFDPFFTTKRDKGGTGLGLAIVRSVVDMHKGRIEVINRKDGNGVKVTLMFRVENNMEGLRSWIKRQKY